MAIPQTERPSAPPPDGDGHGPQASALAAALTGAEMIDLSVTLAEEMPAAWPGHMPFQRKVFNWYASRTDQIQPIHGFRGGYQTAWWTIDEHTGTHFDAATHFVPPPDSGLPGASPLGLETGDRVALDRLVGPAAVIDAAHLFGQGAPGESPEIPVAVVRAWEERHGALRPGEVVLLRTGWDAHYRPVTEGGAAFCADPVARGHGPGWPTPEIPLLAHLLERGVRTVGIDGASMGSSHNGGPLHQWGLGRGMLFVEQLSGLDRLPARGAFFVFLPVKVAGSSGGPGRAVAFVPRQ